MVAMHTPKDIETNWVAADFNLQGVNDSSYNLDQVRGESGLVIAFICNHCPYVKSISKKIAFEAQELKKIGVGFVAINSNDTINYPDDSFDNMKIFAKENDFSFPYLFDNTQEVARKYNAICTPDFFGFNKDLTLQYRGRLDEAKKEIMPNAKRELYMAMKEIAEKGVFSGDIIQSIGCSIKWKEEV